VIAEFPGSDDAYRSRILEGCTSRSGRNVARGAVYLTLARLESKGAAGVADGSGTPARGGQPRCYYTVRSSGLWALKESLDVRMREGLKIGLKHP
jgi:PadR family transcriptional regulator, regulatory protein PadR